MAPSHSPHFVASHRQGKKLRFSKEAPPFGALVPRMQHAHTLSRVTEPGATGCGGSGARLRTPPLRGCPAIRCWALERGGEHAQTRKCTDYAENCYLWDMHAFGACQSWAAGDIRSLGVLNRFGGLRARQVSQAAAARQDDVGSRALAPRLAAMEPLIAQSDLRRNTPQKLP